MVHSLNKCNLECSDPVYINFLTFISMAFNQSTAAAALAYGDVLRDKTEDGRRSGKYGTASQDGGIQFNMWRT